MLGNDIAGRAPNDAPVICLRVMRNMSAAHAPMYSVLATMDGVSRAPVV